MSSSAPMTMSRWREMIAGESHWEDRLRDRCDQVRHLRSLLH